MASAGRKLALRDDRLAFFTQVEFEADGRTHRLDARDAAQVAFEHCSPVRAFPSWRGKRNYDGLYWSSTASAHVGFESLYEKTALMLLDRDPSVIGIASQPMWFLWPKDSTAQSHAPDFFVRHESGDGEVIDVRPADRIDERTAEVFNATRELCDAIGFRYRVICDLDAQLSRNLLFLARYRGDEFALPTRLVDRFKRVTGLDTSVRELASALDDQERALGWVYWLIWWGEVDVDLGKPISLASSVTWTIGWGQT